MENALGPRRSGNPRILIVDDHDASRLHAAAVLRSGPGCVRQSRNAQSALHQVFNWYPQVICMDLQLPDLGGLEVVRRIRAGWPPERQPPRIILLTGDASAVTADLKSSLGIDQVLLKPAPGRELEEAVYSIHQGRVSEPLAQKHRHKIRQLFRSELQNRLPELEKLMAEMRFTEMASILHQLIAAAAMSGEGRLEKNLREMAAVCRDGWSAASLAECYYALLESAGEFLSVEDPAGP